MISNERKQTSLGVALGLLAMPVVWIFGAVGCMFCIPAAPDVFLPDVFLPDVFRMVAILGIAVGGFLAWRSGGWRALLWVMGLLLTFICADLLLADYSSDGIVYHQPTLQAMLDGWNIIHERLLYSSLEDDIPALLQHYSKGLELAGLPPVALLGNIEVGKLMNLMLPAAAAFTIVAALPELEKWKRVAAAILFVGNPVVISQMLTFYNDALLYSELLLLIFGYLLYRQSEKRFSHSPSRHPANHPTQRIEPCASNAEQRCSSALNQQGASSMNQEGSSEEKGRSSCRRNAALALMAGATLAATSTKFTHTFYFGLAWGVILIWNFVDFRRWGKLMSVGLVAALVGILVLNYNPYITNTIYWGDPFYPLLSGELDIMTSNTPEMYYDHGRVANFMLAQLSTESEPLAAIHHPSLRLLTAGMEYGARALPFGILFLPMMVVALALLLISRDNGRGFLIAALLVGATFIFEQAWWGRYAPFLWAMIGLSATWFWRYGSHKPKLARILIVMNMLMALATMSLCAKKSLGGAMRQSGYIEVLPGQLPERPAPLQLQKEFM